MSSANRCSASSAPAPRRSPSSCAPASSSAPLTTTGPPISRSLPNWAATTTPSPPGAGASPRRAFPAYSTDPAPAGRRSFPPSQRLHVLELATTEDPAQAGCPSASWSLDDLAFTILREAHHRDLLLARLAAVAALTAGIELELPELELLRMSRSTVQRILGEADLKPHRSVYWLSSHDPDFHSKARDICHLYLAAPRLFQMGELVICSDEKTGILIRQRRYPTLPSLPGQPRRREHEYIRHGSRHLSVSLCVPTGQVAYDLTQTHNGDDFAAHLRHATARLPQAERYHWVVDNNRTHSTPGVCAAVAQMSGLEPPEALATAKARRQWLSDPSHKHVFHFTPVHGSWLNQAELFFSVVSRKLLVRDDFASAEDFLERAARWLDYHNRELAHPYRWTYSGTPLVRDTPFERTRRQQKRGRAPFSDRPKCFQRLFYPPRPYHRAAPA
jgi:putative transposase